jgi:hypothetical protein
VACAIDQLGRRLAIAEFATTPTGYRAVLEWAGKLGEVQAFGVQGCGCAALDTELARLDAELDRLTAQAAPQLRQLCGVGPEIAGALLAAAGDNPGPLHSEAAFAMLCAASPIPASSGKTVRHRLNRGGNRQANTALYQIVVVAAALAPADPRLPDPADQGGLVQAGDHPLPHWTSIPATIHVELGRDCSVSVRGRPRCFAARRPVSVLPPWTRRGPVTGVRRMPQRGPNNEAPATALSPRVDQDDQRLEAAVLFTGWDWASASHAVTILDAASEVVDRRVFAHTEQDLDTMLARLASHGSPGELPVAIERADGLVVDRLLAAGHPVVAIDPGAFHAAGHGGVPPAPRPIPATATSSRTTCAPTATGYAGWSLRTRSPASCKRWSGCAMTMLPPRPRPA